MRTERPAASGVIQAVSGRAVAVDFDGGSATSDAGALLLGQADAVVGPVDRLAACFEDHRGSRFVEHSVRTLVGRRAFGIALGDEDLLDHDALLDDPMMAVLAGKSYAKRRTHPRRAPNGGQGRDLPTPPTRRRRAQALPSTAAPRPARLSVDRAGGMRQYGGVVADVRSRRRRTPVSRRPRERRTPCPTPPLSTRSPPPKR